MAKLAIFLCAVLFASAVNASFVSEALISAINKTDNIITGVISAAKEKFEDIKNRVLELVAKLEAAASSYSEKLYQQIKSKLEEVQLEVNKLTGKDYDGVDVTECNKLVSHLEDTAYEAVGSIGKCVAEKLEIGNGYVNNIITLSENVLSNLTAIKEEAHHCGDNVNSLTSAADAIVCTNAAALRAMWVGTKTVPSVTVQMTKIAYLLATLEPSLVYCSIVNEISNFNRESAAIIEETRECIREKVNAASPNGEDVEYVSEKIYETTPKTTY